MRRWLLVVLAVGSVTFCCCGGALLLAMADDGAPGATARAGACGGTIDGWQQTITGQGVVLTRGEVTAELPWAFPFSDALRAGDSELNVLNAVAGVRFTPRQLQRGGYGELWLAGPATERSSGRTVYLAFTSGAVSGIANPVLVVGPDASIVSSFSSANSLLALQSLNRFALSCTTLEGQWKSGFNTAAERYSASTGAYLGATAIAAWRELTLDDGSYTRTSSALNNGVFFKSTDSGRWSHDDWSLTLEPEGTEVKRFHAALVAVQHGFLLRLTDQKFTADVEEFRRVE